MVAAAKPGNLMYRRIDSGRGANGAARANTGETNGGQRRVASTAGVRERDPRIAAAARAESRAQEDRQNRGNTRSLFDGEEIDERIRTAEVDEGVENDDAPPQHSRVNARRQPRVGQIAEHESDFDDENFDRTGRFNPRSIGRRGDPSMREATTAREGRLWNEDGEVDAGSKREALERVAHLVLNQLSNERVRHASQMQRVSREERKRRTAILRRAWSAGERGLRLIGQEMRRPIEETLMYESVAENRMVSVNVDLDEFYRVPKDVDVTAFVLAPDSRLQPQRLKTTYLVPVKYRIMANFDLDGEDEAQISYDIMERGAETAGSNMRRESDKAWIELVTSAAEDTNTVIRYTTVGPAVLEALRYEVESWGRNTTAFVMERSDVSEVLNSMAPMLDPVSQREFNVTGTFGRFYGNDIVVFSGRGEHQILPAGDILALPDPELLGEYINYTDVIEEPYNEAVIGQWARGILFVKVIGMIIPSTRNLAIARRL